MYYYALISLETDSLHFRYSFHSKNGKVGVQCQTAADRLALLRSSWRFANIISRFFVARVV